MFFCWALYALDRLSTGRIFVPAVYSASSSACFLAFHFRVEAYFACIRSASVLYLTLAGRGVAGVAEVISCGESDCCLAFCLAFHLRVEAYRASLASVAFLYFLGRPVGFGIAIPTVSSTCCCTALIDNFMSFNFAFEALAFLAASCCTINLSRFIIVLIAVAYCSAVFLYPLSIAVDNLDCKSLSCV